jgi:Protein of unknown function (DUF2927)
MASPQFRQTFRATVIALAVLGLAGCDVLKSPAATVAAAPPDVARAAPVPPSAASQELSRYYARVQTELVAQGLLRTDGGMRDAPFTDRILAQNFIRIAAFDEYVSGAKGPIQSETPSAIRRWDIPVRIGLRFGASVPPDQRTADTARVAAFVAQLARATRHPIRMDNANPNFIVQIVNEDERMALGPIAAAALNGATATDIAGITNMPRSTYCLVYAQSDAGKSTYTRAFAVVRAEHPDLLRLSCLHEEIAQGLGLANDSPQARPSIFNDNEEFALLTPQDELMLRILYDPRLTPGMTAAEARPIAEALATQFMGGES